MATELDLARAQVEEALKLCDSETADGIIGAPQPEEYGTLIKGVKAVHMMLWMMAKANGMRETKATLTMSTQAMLMLATIVHYAYALGMRRGSESANQRVSDGDTVACPDIALCHHDTPVPVTGSEGEQDLRN